MKCIVIFAALVAVSSAGFLPAAAPVAYHAAPVAYHAAPVAYSHPFNHFAGSTQYRNQDTLGQFNYGFASTDGIHREEARGIDGSVAGSFGYTAPDGQRIETAYTAGPGGFRAVGNAIPQPVGPTLDVALATAAHFDAHAQAAHAAYAAPVAAYAAPLAYGHHYKGYYH